jgi:hypothetical protein
VDVQVGAAVCLHGHSIGPHQPSSVKNAFGLCDHLVNRDTRPGAVNDAGCRVVTHAEWIIGVGGRKSTPS